MQKHGSKAPKKNGQRFVKNFLEARNSRIYCGNFSQAADQNVWRFRRKFLNLKIPTKPATSGTPVHVRKAEIQIVVCVEKHFLTVNLASKFVQKCKTTKKSSEMGSEC